MGSGTRAKVVGMVKTWQIEIMGSQVLRVAPKGASYGCSSQTKWQWVPVFVHDKKPGLKI